MAKIGRSTGDDFREGSGVSLAHDWSVSTWHGKFTSVYGTVYYTDLSTNGTRYNGCVCLLLGALREGSTCFPRKLPAIAKAVYRAHPSPIPPLHPTPSSSLAGICW